MSDTGPHKEEVESTLRQELQVLIENEEIILSRSELIDESLAENLNNAAFEPSPRDLLYGITTILPPDSNNKQEISSALLNFLTEGSYESLEILSEQDVSDDLMEFLQTLIIRYSEEAKLPQYRAVHGKDYWWRTDADLVIRDNYDNLGINYRFITSHTDVKKLSVDLNANLRLINTLVNNHRRAINQFDERAANATNQELIDNIIEELEALQLEMKQTEE